MSTTPARSRCTWAESDLQMRDYHDQEWGIPQRDSRMLWEMLMLEGFQAGLAWITVLRKRDAFRQAFAGFDPGVVAGFTEEHIQQMLTNPGIIRSRAKIEATIRGAQIYCEMEARANRSVISAGHLPTGRYCRVTATHGWHTRRCQNKYRKN